MADKEKPSLRVGEVAKRAGLSVRTLHFYDEIGLLSPFDRTKSGYRTYGHAEIMRLQQITSLRALGLSLERIKEFLAKGGGSAKEVLRMHIAHLDERAKEMLEPMERLELILRRVDGKGEPLIEDVLETIQEINVISRYFTPDQLEGLEKRGRAIGQERIKEVQEEWKTLMCAFESAMNRGDDPARSEVQALARKSLALAAEFSGGDQGIERGVAARYREKGASNVMKQHGWDIDQSVFDYMNRAMQACRSSGFDRTSSDQKG